MLLKSKTKTNRPASYCIRMKNKQTISFVVSFNILRHLRKKSVMIVGHSFGFAGLFDNKLVYTGIRIGCQHSTVLSEPNRTEPHTVHIHIYSSQFTYFDGYINFFSSFQCASFFMQQKSTWQKNSFKRTAIAFNRKRLSLKCNSELKFCRVFR